MRYVGVDIIEIARIEAVVREWGDRFLRRVYTDGELERYGGRASSLAARFAAKEAVVKVLGTRERGIGWHDIEVLAEPGGRPQVTLHGRAREQADDLGLGPVSVSLSHSREYAVALAVGETV